MTKGLTNSVCGNFFIKR